MSDKALLGEVEHYIASPWGLYQEVGGNGFSARLDFSPYNKRISILDYHFDNNDGPKALNALLENTCTRQGFTKVWGKMAQKDKNLFLTQGFQAEAGIRGYFSNQEDAVICSKFFDQRQSSVTADENNKILQQIKDCDPTRYRHLPEGCSFKLAEQQDLSALAALYRQVFVTYPYPIYDPVFLESNLAHTVYGLVYKDDNLLAAASAEINHNFANAEMTDFATLPSERGQGLASIILEKLEHKLCRMGITCLYTIARSTSLGMNLTFSLASYQYSGTLMNNCNISGGFEDMNVFYKLIQD